MNITSLAIVAIMLLLPGATGASDDSPPQLQHNPFSRPMLLQSAPGVADSSGESNIPILLRATMVSARSRLAEVDGQVLKPGDIVNGYRLVQVFEDRAVFERDGVRTTLYVKTDESRDAEVAPQSRRLPERQEN